MVAWIKTLDAKTDNLTLNLITHLLEGENWTPQWFSDPHIYKIA